MTRKLWGVELSHDGERLGPLFMGWHGIQRAAYEGEPTRPMLFTTRTTARKWCKNKMAVYSHRTDQCAKWRFSPIPVEERLS